MKAVGVVDAPVESTRSDQNEPGATLFQWLPLASGLGVVTPRKKAGVEFPMSMSTASALISTGASSMLMALRRPELPLVPPNSKVAVLPAARFNEPTVRVPTLAPGARIAPDETLTNPAMVPDPPSVAPELIVTVPEPVEEVEALARSVPAATVVPPE